MPPDVLDAPKVVSETQNKLDDVWELIMWNDDVHSFLYVIVALMQICGHTKELAERLANEVHNEGKAIVEVGDKETLQKYKDQLQELQLTVEIQRI